MKSKVLAFSSQLKAYHRLYFCTALSQIL